MEKYMVFESHPYEGFWEREFDSLKEARAYAKSIVNDEDVMEVYVVKNMGL